MRRLLAALFFAAVTSNASAVPITYAFSGSLTVVPSELSFVLAVGEEFTGSVTIDSEAVDLNSDPTFGVYGGNPSLQITIGGSQFADAAGGRVLVLDLLSEDSLVLFGDVTGTLGGFSSASFTLALGDSTATVFSSDALPSDVALEDFSRTEFSMGFRDVATRELFRVEGTLGAFSATVDEPATTLLALSALGWCLLFASRSPRSAAGIRRVA